MIWLKFIIVEKVKTKAGPTEETELVQALELVPKRGIYTHYFPLSS